MTRNDLSTTRPQESSPTLKQRRAPAPTLSPQHIASARSLSYSRTSTPTPSLLTPPVSGTRNMSPPPRHEAADYMNVHGPSSQQSRKKHPRRKTRKLRNTREGSGGSRLPQRSLRSGPQTTSSNGSDCEVCAADISDGDDEEDSKAPLVKSPISSNLLHHLHGPQSSTKYDALHVEESPTVKSLVATTDEPDSPAVSSLRSLSFQIPARSNSQGLQRVSTALANTLNLFRPGPAVSFAPVSTHNASKKAEEASRKSSAHSKSLAYRDVNRHHPTLQDGNDASRALETPATITLRKASNVHAVSPIQTSMGASLAREPQFERAADAPASELLAFYSSPARSDLSSPASAETPKSLREQPTLTFAIESRPFRERSKSVSQFNDVSNARRCSTPAEASLTFADVHVAPGSFTVGPKSRKQSLVPVEHSRRISTVKFRSNNSVHEVIWREDETPSDSSLTASSRASQQAGHSFRSTPSPESEGSPTREPAVKPKQVRSILPVIPRTMGKFAKRPDNLFGWSWGGSPASLEGTPHAVDRKSDTPGPPAETTVRLMDANGDPLAQVLVMCTPDPGFDTLEKCSDQQGSRFQKPSFSELPSVESFPPLRPRSSTAEWQKAPLVDLNDPLAGRVTRYQDQKIRRSEGLGIDTGSSKRRGKEGKSSRPHHITAGRRSKSSPQNEDRGGSVVGVGSGIGASSHKRVATRPPLSVKFSC